MAERNEEIASLKTQIEERERELPLRERIKEIFKKYAKKYGMVPVAAIFLAAGATIAAVIETIMNALKKKTENRWETI